MSVTQDRKRIVLAAHGEAGDGPLRDARLASLRASLEARAPQFEWMSARVSDADALHAALSDAAGRLGLVVPLLFSDGFFYDQRLAPAATRANEAGAQWDLARPIGEWPALVRLTATEVTASSARRVLIIAHGSARSSNSADAARSFAAALERATGAACETAFLEEPPAPADVYRVGASFDVVLGLFFGAGLHGDADFEAAVARAPTPPKRAIVVGALGGLDAMIARHVEDWADGA